MQQDENVMTTQKQLLWEKLQKIYDRAQAHNAPRSFFVTVSEFLDVYDQTPAFEPFIKKLLAQEKEDTKKLKDLEQITLTEMEETFKKITQYIEKHKVSIAEINESIERYKAYKDNLFEPADGQVEARFGVLTYIIISLKQRKPADHIEFAQQHGELHDDGYILEWKLAPTYPSWKEEKQIVERFQITKPWYSWEELVEFFYFNKNFEKLKKERLKKNQLSAAISLNMTFEEINETTDYREDRKWYLKNFFVGAYKVYLERILIVTKEFLLAEDEINEQTTDMPNYDASKAKLTVNAKFAVFEKEGFRAKLLAHLTKNRKHIKKKWSWDEIYQAIEGTEPTDEIAKQYKRKIYYAGKAINSYILDKTGLNDFLEYDTNYVQIYPSLATKM